MSRYCKSCKNKEPLKKESQEEYDKWYENNKDVCQLNHTGSAGAMELSGATKIFSRSVNNLKRNTLVTVIVKAMKSLNQFTKKRRLLNCNAWDTFKRE